MENWYFRMLSLPTTKNIGEGNFSMSFFIKLGSVEVSSVPPEIDSILTMGDSREHTVSNALEEDRDSYYWIIPSMVS